jgi:biopolymer transport protein TolR
MGMANGAGTGIAVSEINVTPLIDVLLVLLIIFMVIVPATPRGLGADVPQPPKSHAQTPPDDAIVVSVVADSTGQLTYRINQDVIPRSQIEPRLAGIFAARQQKTMFVTAGPSIAFSRVAELIDLGHQADAHNIGLLSSAVLPGRPAQ